MMRKEAIKGMTPSQIKIKYALPDTPKYISEVHVPSGTNIRKGKIGGNDFGDIEGAVQYELLDRLPKSAFKNTKEILGAIE
jgi:filamentous hemagglutinin